MDGWIFVIKIIEIGYNFMFEFQILVGERQFLIDLVGIGVVFGVCGSKCLRGVTNRVGRLVFIIIMLVFLGEVEDSSYQGVLKILGY